MELFIIYCPWVWIWAYFYLHGQTNKSPFISSFIGFIYTFITQLFFAKYSFILRLLLISIEGYVLFRTYFKHISLNKRFTLRNLNLDYNLALFLIFNIFLCINNTSFSKVYINDIRGQRFTVKSWILKKLKPL